MISNLKQLKQSTITIEKSLKESLELQLSLETERSTYNDIARYGSRLYFAINDLAKLNHCYRFSVPAFLRVYSKNLHLSDKVKLDPILLNYNE
jgi:dynein heavy chain 2